jgi:hypothetical protein
MVKISTEMVQSLRVPLLDLEEQRRVIRFLDVVTEAEKAAEAEIVKLRAMRSGMINDLLGS